MTQSTDERVRKNSEASKRGLRSTLSKMTPEERRGKFGKGKKVGGIRKGSGRGKKGWCRGYWCDSSWELAWVVYSLDHGVEFSRNTQGFTYSFEGIESKFYPDFLLTTGEYVEVKGWVDLRNHAKISQFKGGTLIVLGKREMKPMLAYMETTYGRDFITLMGLRPANQCGCGAYITPKYIRCQICAAKLNHKDKIVWPSLTELKKQIHESGFEATGRILGVSGNAVKKRLNKLVALAAFETATLVASTPCSTI